LKRKLFTQKDISYVLAFNQKCKNYSHWVTESLPRFFVIREKLKDSGILLPESISEFQRDSLAPFSFKKIYNIPLNSYVRVENLILPTHTAGTGNYNEILLRQMRSFYQASMSCQLDLGDRLYISRRKAARRHIINEVDVENALISFGFKSINFEDFSFWEQVSLAFHSRFLISLHGAGLTNMLFMKPGSFVLEFRKTGDATNLCYYSLASALKLHYLYQFAAPANAGESTYEADVLVDIPLLRKNVERMLKGNVSGTSAS
jgi:capsular polysaccharide biosynthesis protein